MESLEEVADSYAWGMTVIQLLMTAGGGILLFSFCLRQWMSGWGRGKQVWVRRLFPNLTNDGLLYEYTCDDMPVSFRTVQSRRFVLYVPPSLCPPPNEKKTKKGGEVEGARGVGKKDKSDKSKEKKSKNTEERIVEDERAIPNDLPAGSIPMVVIFHPPNQTAYSCFKMCSKCGDQSWQKIANQNKFVVLFAEAMYRHCKESPKDYHLWLMDKFDKQYIGECLSEVFKECDAIDKKAVYAVGYSSQKKRDIGMIFSASIALQFNSFQAVAHHEFKDFHGSSASIIPQSFSLGNMSDLMCPASKRGKSERPKVLCVIPSQDQKSAECVQVIRNVLEKESWPLDVVEVEDAESHPMHAKVIWEYFDSAKKRA